MEDAKVIKEIMDSVGVWDKAMLKVGSEAELVDLFVNDFEGLLQLCVK